MTTTQFESCIKCTVCTTVCPVSAVNPAYPGPKQAGPDGERLRLKDPALFDEALKYRLSVRRKDWRYYSARAFAICRQSTFTA